MAGVIGCLGDIIFTVSRETVRTLHNIKWSGSARYATHARHMTHALTEFTGLDPDKISFDILLTSELGTDPMDEVVKIWNIERKAIAVPLTIGTHGYGKYRWTITDHKMQPQAHYGNGDIHTATVSISLLEYLRE